MDILYWAVAIILICGFLAYLLSIATFIAEPFKSWGKWAIIAVGGILFIVKVVLPLLSMLLAAI